MKISYPLITFIFLLLNGCSDFSSDSSEYELSGKMYVCDGSVQGDIINDSKFGKKYCNGDNWITLIPEDSVSEDSTPVMYECENGEVVKYKDLCTKNPSDYLPLDDTEYPYAGIPRIVIETKNRRKILDRETEIPAKLQIWGEKAPETNILPLTIHGRGVTSWEMPKKSYKIEFSKKEYLLDMPENRDWVLIANYADKSLLRNYAMYMLSQKLNLLFSPKNKFIELFLNGEYVGLYQLIESIKVSKNRVNIPQNSNSYIIEFDANTNNNEITFTSTEKKLFTIHYPKNPDTETQDWIKNKIDKTELFIKNSRNIIDSIDFYFHVNDYIKHYWLQEFSKNIDGNFRRSVYFSTSNHGSIRMGPIWDFDIALGNHYGDSTASPIGWRMRDSYWNEHLFKQRYFEDQINDFWIKNESIFLSVTDSIKKKQKILSKAARNNFKRWPILQDTIGWWRPHKYATYEEAVDDLNKWIKLRMQWIDEQIE